MFKPQYTISPKLLSNIKEVAVLVAQLNQNRYPETILFELEQNAQVRSSHSSTSIEGNPLPLTEVKKILKNKPEHIRDSQQEVLNYNQALEYLKKQKQGLDLKLILKIQALVMDKLLPKAKLGKLRKEPVLINDPQSGRTVFLPPDHTDVSKLIKDLIDFYKKNTGKLDPLILSGIFHKQFVIIHPFIDGNGRTTRLITKQLLAQLGLNTFNLFSFENYYNSNVSKYFNKVGVTGNYYDICHEIDFTEWLEYFTDGIIDELVRVNRDLNQSSISPKQNLAPHHKKIIKYIEKHGYINDKLYSKLTDRAKATRSLDFKKLIGLDLIERQGKGKNTHYKLKT
ncbi:MAG: Fic family protein [Candidatus Melainabacteria bacterium]|nr:Fic family protein [Candidatus Melainabacteria bacterium]